MESVANEKPTLTELEVAIDEAMQASEGNKASAAKLLGASRDTIVARIKGSPILSAKWISRKEKDEAALATTPTAEASINGMSPVAGEQIAPVLLTEKAAEAQYESLKKSMQATGLSADTTDHALAVHRFYDQHHQHMMTLLGGGIVYCATKTLEMAQRLEREQYPDEFSIEGMLVKSGQRVTDDTILRCYEHYEKRSLAAMNMSLMATKLAAAKNESGGKGRRSKPGFSPMRVQVVAQPGSNLSIGEKS